MPQEQQKIKKIKCEQINYFEYLCSQFPISRTLFQYLKIDGGLWTALTEIDEGLIYPNIQSIDLSTFWFVKVNFELKLCKMLKECTWITSYVWPKGLQSSTVSKLTLVSKKNWSFEDFFTELGDYAEKSNDDDTKFFPNLTNLTIVGRLCFERSFSFLVNMKQLKILKIDFETHVKFGNVPVVLMDLPLLNLTELEISYCRVSDGNLRLISSLRYLVKLVLKKTGITTFQVLTNLELIKYLNLMQNEITSICKLSSLKSLLCLNLSSNGITRDGLANLDVSPPPSLTHLYLDTNPLFGVDSKFNLPKLEYLSMCDCSLSKIDGLSGLRGLKELYLGGNTLFNDEVFSGLINLEKLMLYDNHISDMSAFQDMTKLYYLDLQKNQIDKVCGLSKLEELKHLNLMDNQIKSICKLSKLESLLCLNIAVNKISKAGLANLIVSPPPSLTHLYLDRKSLLGVDYSMVNLERLEYLVICD